MGKNLKGKELGKGIRQKKNNVYEARAVVNGISVCVSNLDLKVCMAEFNKAKEQATQNVDIRNQTITLNDLKSVITDTSIQIGEYTMYNDFVHDPRDFQKNNVLYHYPINGNHLKTGKFCSIACGAKSLFTSANHAMRSLSTYPFPIFFEEWGLDVKNITSAWDNRGDIAIGNDVPPYTIVGVSLQNK